MSEETVGDEAAAADGSEVSGVASLVGRVRRHGVGDLLRRTARRYPDKLAVVSGDYRMTYAEFDLLVNRTANALTAGDVAKGDRIGLFSHNCWEFVTLSLALARLGAVLVPINFMLGPEEVAFILGNCGASGLITEDVLSPVAEQALARTGLRGGIRGWIALGKRTAARGWEDVADWADHDDDSEPVVAVSDDEPLQLMYTSGTESRPKGVMLSSRSLIAQYVSCIVDGGMTADDVEIHALPLYHCAQLHCFFMPDVYLGATSVILGGPDATGILKAIEAERATKLFAPPTVWISLLRTPAFDTTDLSSLRKGYYGASAMPVEVLREIQQRLPDVRLWNFYGQTEMSPVATILPPEDQLSHPGSAGRAVLNVETSVVDDLDQPIGPGVIGEIVHRSPHVALGYWNDHAKTAEVFRNGWFHSGDLGVFSDDGYLSVVDRKKDMIKTGGENVASREVEETIYQLESVAEVAVFGIAHPRWIEAVTAVVVPRPGANFAPESVIDHCRAHLAGFKVPKYVVVADHLPKNPSGKILKRDLRLAYAHVAEEATP